MGMAMYMRVTAGDIRPENIDRAAGMIRAALPAVGQQKGLKHYFGGINPKTGKTVAISVWETEADAVAFGGNSMVQQVQAKLFPLFEATPTTEIYEVRADA